MTCRDCKNVASPEDCRGLELCIQGDICYTREFTDHLGRQAFHLGCEQNTTCQLMEKASVLFGKRDASEVNPSPPQQCFECCSSDECNAALCQRSVKGHSVTPLVTTAPSLLTTEMPRCRTSGCPESFVSYKDHCYLFNIGHEDWNTARKACQTQGAYLLSINSKQEHDFIKQSLVKLNASYIDRFWIGGVCSHRSGKWTWLDGTPFSYLAWDSGNSHVPCPTSEDFYAVINNPAYAYPKALWSFTQVYTNRFGFLCEKSQSH